MDKMNLRERRRQKRIEESLNTVKKSAVVVLAFAVVFTAIFFGVKLFTRHDADATGGAEKTDMAKLQEGSDKSDTTDVSSADDAGSTKLSSDSQSPDDESSTLSENSDNSVSDNSIEDTTIYFSHKDWINDHPKVRGIYVTGSIAGSERFDEMIRIADETEINTFVIDIKNDGGEVTYLMDDDTLPGRYDCCVNFIRDIDGMMKTLKKHNVYTIARIVCFKDPLLAKARNDLALMNSQGTPVTDGAGNAWVNPCSEEVWDYIASIAETCADLGFDEIQFDYVRFPVGDAADAADYGTDLTPEKKHEYITGFLNYAAERIHKKGIPVTADLFGTVIGNPTDVLNVGQDYAELASCVDALCPMIYPSHYGVGNFNLDVPDAHPYETILAALEGSKEELADIDAESCAVVRPWLQDFTATWVDGYITYGEAQIRDQIKAVYDAGYDEWILWNAKNNYTTGGLAAE